MFSKSNKTYMILLTRNRQNAGIFNLAGNSHTKFVSKIQAFLFEAKRCHFNMVGKATEENWVFESQKLLDRKLNSKCQKMA